MIHPVAHLMALLYLGHALMAFVTSYDRHFALTAVDKGLATLSFLASVAVASLLVWSSFRELSTRYPVSNATRAVASFALLLSAGVVVRDVPYLTYLASGSIGWAASLWVVLLGAPALLARFSINTLRKFRPIL